MLVTQAAWYMICCGQSKVMDCMNKFSMRCLEGCWLHAVTCNMKQNGIKPEA